MHNSSKYRILEHFHSKWWIVFSFTSPMSTFSSRIFHIFFLTSRYNILLLKYSYWVLFIIRLKIPMCFIIVFNWKCFFILYSLVMVSPIFTSRSFLLPHSLNSILFPSFFLWKKTNQLTNKQTNHKSES